MSLDAHRSTGNKACTHTIATIRTRIIWSQSREIKNKEPRKFKEGRQISLGLWKGEQWIGFSQGKSDTSVYTQRRSWSWDLKGEGREKTICRHETDRNSWVVWMWETESQEDFETWGPRDNAVPWIEMGEFTGQYRVINHPGFPGMGSSLEGKTFNAKTRTAPVKCPEMTCSL